MDFCRDWIEKPRRVILLLALLCILAMIFSLSIPLGYLPGSTKKTILITLEYPGALEKEIERTLVEPVEARLSIVAGITEISSVCEKDRARVLITFSERTDLDAAFLAVRDIVYAVHMNFPPDVQRPIILKSDPAGTPVFIAGFPIKGGLSKEDLKRTFENVEGSGEVEIAGSAKSQVVIRFDPQKIPVAGVELPDLIHSVRKTNILGGFGREAGPSFLLDSRFRNVNELLDLMVSPGVRLRELADVRVQKRSPEVIGRINGKERLVLYVYPEGDANVLELCRRLERLSKRLPDAEILYNNGRLIRRALVQVLHAAGIGIVCVIALTFLFMRRLLPALLISANIPFSVIVSLAALRLAGEELNILSLSGIAVGVGLVIDAGVVFVEEYFRRGNDYSRAISGTRGPILLAAATTGAVFLPLLFAPQMLIEQFRGLALAIVGSVAASCVFVFCFLPAILHAVYGSCKVVIGSQRNAPKTNSYRCLLPAMLIMNRFRRFLAAAGLVLAVLLSAMVFGMAREGYAGSGLEQEVLRFSVEYPSGYTTEYILKSASGVEQQLLCLRGVEQVSSKYEPERASFFVQLADSTRRDEIISALENKEIELVEAFLYFPNGTAGSTSFSVVLSGMIPGELEHIARQLAEQIQRLPRCRGVLFHFKDELPAVQLHVDLQKAARMEVDTGDLYNRMYWALSAPVVDKWTTAGEEKDIVLQAGTLDRESQELSALLKLQCPKSSLPIDSLVSVSEKTQVGRIYHQNRTRSVQISVFTDWKNRRSLLAGTQTILSSFSFPPGYRAERL